MTQQLTKDDLRGCPFCGGLGDIEQIESGCFGVGCQDCDFQLMNGTIGLGWHKSESDAIRAWNERNSDLCIQGLQDWTKKLQSSLDAANSRIAELEQGKCLLQIAEPAAQGLDAREFPPMTPELASILGLMCFQCISFAQALRAGGHQIASRAEDEQAAVLHWMLGHYFRHGDDWRTVAAEDMKRMEAEALAAQAKQGGAA